MIANYLKIALRNLFRQRGYSVINIAGLSIGLASGFIIMLCALDDMSYDRYNENLDNIYVVTTESPDFKSTNLFTPFGLGPALRQEYPDVQEFSRWMKTSCTIKYKDKEFESAPCVSSDSSIFRILTLPLESGSLNGVSAERNTAVISSAMAQRLFGVGNPIGEVITINWRGVSYDLKINAVMKDIPRTSTFRAEVMVPLFIGEKWISGFMEKVTKKPLDVWGPQIVPTYVLLSSSSDRGQVENKMAFFSKSHPGPNERTQFHLFPLKDLYFHSSGLGMSDLFPQGDITQLHVYSTIAVLTLLIACINFVILCTGRASIRTKEIAVRKVIGASRLDLMKLIMMESILLSILSLPVALFLVELFLTPLSQLLGKRLIAGYFYSLEYLMIFAGITLFAGILSGSYVSFYLSGFRPMDILRSKLSTGGSKARLRKIMIAVQMVIFIGLITGSMTIYEQVRHFHNKDMGFDNKNLLVLTAGNHRMDANFETVKAELMTDPAIAGVCGANYFPGSENGQSEILPDKSDPSKKIRYQSRTVDRDFIETMKMKMVRGKSFAEATAEEIKNAVIINETAMREFGIGDPSRDMIQGQRVLGVVKDFNIRSLRDAIEPMIINCSTEHLGEIAVRVQLAANLATAVNFVDAKSKSFNNGKPMTRQLFDERLDGLYGNEYRFAQMIGFFTALATFIACLGLFGVSLFVIQTRVKEIGIRKVLGAPVGTIFYLVAKEFIVLTLISTIIAVPITMYSINGWLQNYAYRVNVDVFVVLASLIAAMFIVLVTIGYQALRAATANPVEALRYE